VNRRITYTPWFAVIVMFVAQLLSAAGNLSVAPLAVYFQKSFAATHIQIGLLTSTVALGAFLFAILGGWLVDIYGCKMMLLVFGIVLSFSYFCIGVIGSYYWALPFMFLIGICYGAMTPITTKSIVQWFDPSKRGLAISFKQTGVVAGGALASLFITYFGEQIGWRMTVEIFGLLFLVIYLIIGLLYKDAKRVDVETVSKRTDPQLGHQTVAILKNNIFILLCLLMSLFLWGQFSLTTYLLLFLNEKLNFPLIWAGVGTSSLLIGGICGRMFWGWVSDRFYKNQRIRVIFYLACFGFLLVSGLSFFPPGISVIATCMYLFVCGAVITGWNGVMITVIVETVAETSAGLVSGISYSLGNLGTMLGVPITGFMIGIFGYSFALRILGVVLFIAACVALLLIKKMEGKQKGFIKV
jgi:ACS family hexuronate transporter-like MFS transporter